MSERCVWRFNSFLTAVYHGPPRLNEPVRTKSVMESVRPLARER